jgi:GT2 family glycosyltransferase
MKTSIVIVTYNQLDYTQRCLDSIRKHTHEEFELIVVDNGSKDSTIDYLKKQTDVISVFNDANYGFAKGCNIGVEQSTGENVLFLNNDTVVTENWLTTMLRVLYSNDNIGMVGPVSNYCSGSQQIPVAYHALHELDEFVKEHSSKYKGQSYSHPRLVGFCLLVKKKLLDEIGVFDEQFGVGTYEDDDLCLRAIKKGYDLKIVLDSFVHHEGHITFSNSPELNMNKLMKENSKKAKEKWGNDIISLLYNSKVKNKFTISLCMIVKNEEDTISRCLDSVKDLVDEIIIVDTGSTDNTKEIVKTYTDRILDFEWIDDFAAARNFAFSHATMDYILWLDADDVLLEEDQVRFKKLKETLTFTVDAVSMKYNIGSDENGNPALTFRRNRLVKRVNQFKWHGAVHEYLAVGGNIINSDVAVTHKSIRHDSERNLRIYEKRLAEEEEFTPRDLFYYANELMDHKIYDKAIEFYQKFLDTKQGWVEDNIKACSKLADCYHTLGNTDTARKFILKSLEYDIPRPEFCCRLGYQFLEKKEYEKAIFWYKLAIQVGEKHDNWGFVNPSFSTWLPHLQLCVCYDRLGNYEEAYFYNEKARAFNPKNDQILYNQKYFNEILNK